MTMSDPLGDMLTRIRNGQRAKMSAVTSPASRMRAGVLDVLKSEGFIRGYSQREVSKGINELVIELKYHEGEPVIREISRVSTPGRRVYSGIKDLPREYGGLGIKILSTPKGILSDHVARAENHPDNAAATVFGGFRIASRDGLGVPFPTSLGSRRRGGRLEVAVLANDGLRVVVGRDLTPLRD